MPRIKLYVNTGFVGANHVDYIEVDDADWEVMTEDEREEYLDELAADFMSGCIDYGAYVVED